MPLITVPRALEIFWALARDKTLGKSADQIRRWRYGEGGRLAMIAKLLEPIAL